MRGAIRRPCRRQGTACRTETAKIRIAKLKSADHKPPKNPPSAPAHSARPTQNDRPPDFCDFHFARHWPSQMQKTYPPRIVLRICIKNASFKLLLLCFSCFNSLFASHVFKNVLPAYTGSMILQNDFKQFQSKFSLF